MMIIKTQAVFLSKSPNPDIAAGSGREQGTVLCSLKNRSLFSPVPCDKNPGISAGVCVKVCRKAAHFILFVYLAVCFDFYSFVDSEYVAEIVGVCCVSVIIFAAAAEP